MKIYLRFQTKSCFVEHDFVKRNATSQSSLVINTLDVRGSGCLVYVK